MKYLLKIPGALLLLVLMALALSCAKDSYFDMGTSQKEGTPYTPETKGRVSPMIERNVLIMISGGRNSLSGYLTEDLAELENSYLPVGKYASGNVLIVFSRIGYSKATETPAALYRAYRDHSGNVVRDTLRTWGGFTPMFGETTLKDALQLVVDEFPGSHYGIVLSSHATGYLPDGYYKDPDAYERNHGAGNSAFFSMGRRSLAGEVFPPIPDYPAVKSIGQDDDAYGSVEMELRAFRDAIPCRMDYILFDACLMGCVETAYELRDKAGIIGFSPTEILADGFDYKLLTSRLLKDEPDPVQVCRDYFAQYSDGTTTTGDATITAVNTEHLEELAAVCRVLFEKYRSNMNSVNASNIQRYFRMERHFFYDIRDIIAKSGASEEDLAALDEALEKVVIYKDHTDFFLSIPIAKDTYSGMSMYLPARGSAILDSFYRENLDWNTATQLVK
ncbi:MAG: hypothetical protein IJU21_06685 [Bacteroidales bacterium]|nr:hypothetical protein [Bacteroidales bacterium]